MEAIITEIIIVANLAKHVIAYVKLVMDRIKMTV